MGNLTLDERGYIEIALTIETPIAEIAKHLGRHRSTIYREIKRNSYQQGKKSQVTDYPYSAINANNLAHIRKKKTGSKSKVTKRLIERITHYLNLKLSPEQIVHGIPKITISVGTIYNWIYKRILSFSRKNLRHKGKRYKKNTFGKVLRQPDSDWFKERSLDKRPISCNHRTEFGHWEADSVLSSREGKSALATFVERKTRKYKSYKVKDQTSHSMFIAMKKLVAEFPGTVKSITCDRGSEFTNQEYVAKLEKRGIAIYFAKPHSPYERGSNENHNGLLREYYPKGTNFNQVTQKELNKAILAINSRPRKVLHWKSANDRFNLELAYMSKNE
ncbi:IS30 family transposase [Microbacterium sp.]|uniref:IS30 family transposase n=1 Tax=Microbacterium sp. TaxID=51671 RepID=UPI0028B04571|nr:IS30 family transposase [Microbacterium sp.]